MNSLNEGQIMMSKKNNISLLQFRGQGEQSHLRGRVRPLDPRAAHGHTAALPARQLRQPADRPHGHGRGRQGQGHAGSGFKQRTCRVFRFQTEFMTQDDAKFVIQTELKLCFCTSPPGPDLASLPGDRQQDRG